VKPNSTNYKNASNNHLPIPNSPSPIPNSQFPTPHFLTSQADYEAAVVQAKKYIQAGDIFQANLSLRFEVAN
jgi:para-aminobenzoate synthetase component 1